MALTNDFKVKNGLTVTDSISAGSCIEADSFEKHGGTSSQFLKADGSVDSSAYTTCVGDVTGIDAGTAITVTDGNTATPTVSVTSSCNTAWNAKTTCTGTVTCVSTGPYLTGGGTTTPEIGIDSACASKWDTSAAGDISEVTTSSLLSGGGSSGSVEVGVDSGALQYLNQSACPGICCTGTVTSVTRGSGINGTGSITSTGSIAVGAGTGITVNTNDVALAAACRNALASAYTTTSNLSGCAGLDCTGTTTASNSQTFTNKGGNISQWSNDSGYTCNTGTVTSVTRGSGINGTGSITSTGSIAVGAGTGITVNTNDVALAAACRNALASAYTTTSNLSGCPGLSCTGVGNITCITTSAGLDGSGSSGTVNVSLDLSELADGTGAVVPTSDEVIYLDAGTQKRKLFSEIFGCNAYSSTAFTTCDGTITQVAAGTNLTGGGTSGAVTLNMATGGAGAGAYGSTSNGTKIDTICLDAYGRVTAVATGATGDIDGVTAGAGLSGGGTSGTPTLALDGTCLAGLNQSACQGINCTGTMTSVGVSDGLETTGGNSPTLGIATACNTKWDQSGCLGINCVGAITCVSAGTNLTGGGSAGSFAINMATGGAGSGTYGSTADNTKIDTITLDAYGRVTAVATGNTGDINSICTNAGSLLSGGTGSGVACLGIDSGVLTPFDQSACPGICCQGTTTPSNTQTFTNKSGNISQWTNDCGYLTSACSGTVTNVAGCDGITVNNGTGSACVCVDSTVVRTTGNQTIAGTKTFSGSVMCVSGAIKHTGDANTCIDFSTDGIDLHAGGECQIRLNTNGVVINEPGNPNDFRVEGDTDTHALFVDGSADNVGIGCSAPGCKLTVAGNSLISGNTTIQGNLSVTGDFTYLDTFVDVASAMSIINNGTGPALLVNQTGANDIINFQDDGTSAFYIENGGNVGLGDTNPAHKLDVNGNINAIGSYKICDSDVINAGKCFIGAQVRPTTDIADAYIASAATWNAKTTCTGTTTPSNTQTFTNKSGNISQWTNDSGYGTITCVSAGTNMTGGGSTGSFAINMATGGAGAGTYGSTSNSTKIDSITLDAYGRVTAVACGATGDIDGVTAGAGLSGGGSSGTPTLALDGTCIAGLNQSACPGICCVGTVTSVATGNGIGGGSITSSGTLTVGAGTGLCATANGLCVATACNTAWNAKTTCTGTVTGIAAGNAGIDVGSGTCPSVSLDLSELADGTGAVVPTSDEVIYLDAGTQKRKLFSEIFGCNAYSSTAFTTCVGDITAVVAGSGLTGGATSGSATVNVGAGTAITVAADTVGVNSTCNACWNAKTTCTGTTTPSNTQTFTNKSGSNSQWTNDAGYTTCTGTGVGNITCITTSTGLDGSGSSGTVNVSLDLAELADGTGAVVPTTDEVIYLDSGTQKRKLFSEIFGCNAYSSTAFTTCQGTTTPSNSQTFTNKSGNISQWTNDSGYLTSACSGTVTSVTAGTGMTQSGTSTVNPTLNVIGGTGITANANDVAIDTGVVMNLASAQTAAGTKNFSGDICVGSKIIHTGDSDTYFQFGSNVAYIVAGNETVLAANASEVVINEPGNSNDFRVESDANTHMLFVDGSANAIGINCSTPGATLAVNGSFTATCKSFLVDNPVTGGQLKYGVLEGNEHGVTIRGTTCCGTIDLPAEWDWLVDEDSVTAQITPIGSPHTPYIVSQDNKQVIVCSNGCYNYNIYGTRKDVEPLEVNI